jgi:hypothetical protein
MAYLLTAIMTGGVAAILTLFSGGSWGQIFLSYVLYGNLGMVILAAASMTAAMFDRRNNTKE